MLDTLDWPLFASRAAVDPSTGGHTCLPAGSCRVSLEDDKDWALPETRRWLTQPAPPWPASCAPTEGVAGRRSPPCWPAPGPGRWPSCAAPPHSANAPPALHTTRAAALSVLHAITLLTQNNPDGCQSADALASPPDACIGLSKGTRSFSLEIMAVTVRSSSKLRLSMACRHAEQPPSG